MKLTKRQLKRIIREAIHRKSSLEMTDEDWDKQDKLMDIDTQVEPSMSRQVLSYRVEREFEHEYGYDWNREKPLVFFVPKGTGSVYFATDPGYPTEYVMVVKETGRIRGSRTHYIPMDQGDLDWYEQQGVLSAPYHPEYIGFRPR